MRTGTSRARKFATQLSDYLDALPEQRFDRLAVKAARFLGHMRSRTLDSRLVLFKNSTKNWLGWATPNFNPAWPVSSPPSRMSRLIALAPSRDMLQALNSDSRGIPSQPIPRLAEVI
jgi:hypothetical protein